MKITRRDFSRKVAYYLNLIEQGEVIEVGDLQLCKLGSAKSGELNTYNSRDLNNSKKSDSKKTPKKVEVPKMAMVRRYTVEPNCFTDQMNEWVPYPVHLIAKGVETRPYVPQEEELETYDTGFEMKERASKMNDGSNPVPKPVKKKKK